MALLDCELVWIGALSWNKLTSSFRGFLLFLRAFSTNRCSTQSWSTPSCSQSQRFPHGFRNCQHQNFAMNRWWSKLSISFFAEKFPLSLLLFGLWTVEGQRRLIHVHHVADQAFSKFLVDFCGTYTSKVNFWRTFIAFLKMNSKMEKWFKRQLNILCVHLSLRWQRRFSVASM